jgi:PAS domain S-box-containing protein
MIPEIKINLDQLTGVASYIFTTDRNLLVTWTSPAIRRRVPEAVGANIMDLIISRDPSEELSPETISKLIGAVFKFSLRQGKSALPLAGRWLPSEDGYILMGSPAPENSKELALFSFDDFPEEDHIVELLAGREEARLSSRDATEAVAAFKQSEEKYRRIFELSPEAVVLIDYKVLILDVNDRLFDWLGFTREEVLGKHLLRLPLLPWKSKLKLMRNFTRRMAGGEVPPYDLEFKTRSGEKEFGRVMATPLADEAGHATSELIVIEIITEQKRAEEALHESEERLELAVTGTNLGLWDWNIVTGETIFNRQWAEMLGYSLEEIEPHTDSWKKLVHPDDSPRMIQKLNEHFKENTLFYEVAFRMKTKTGEWKWIQSVGRVSERDENGKPLRILGTHRDISKRKKIEQDLQESEDNLRSVLESLPELIMILDSEGRYLNIFTSNVDLLITPADQIIGKTIDEVLPEKLAQLEKAIIDKTFSTGKPQKIEYEIDINEVGRWFSGQALKFRFQNQDCVLWSVRDITEQKRDEEVIKRSREEAFALSGKLQEAIKQANRMAIEANIANRAKSEFLANMSHEIRTPMNGVIGMAELLMETELTAEQREFTGMISSSADALLQIINDVLDFSKIEAGKLELEMIDFELRSVVEETVEMLAVLARRRGNELTCLIADDLPTILRGDPGRLRQILVNLINNAIKFTENGEVAIRVEAVGEETKDEGRRDEGRGGGPSPSTVNRQLSTLLFSVTDTGIGIPGDKQEQLFKSFSQIDASTTRKYGGTGLGLAIARQLSELMGGEIGVESEEGKGSTFWFKAVFEDRPERREQPRAITVNLEGKRILVVDDNHTNRTIVSTYLTKRDARVSTAAGGEEAIELLREANAAGDPFHLALLDMMMPGMDGETLGRVIKNDPMLRDTTILVMLSSDTWRSSSERLKEIGFAAHLTKPIRPARLFERLAAALGLTVNGVVTRKKTQSPPPGDRLVKRSAGPARILLVEDNPVNQMVATRMLEKLGYQSDVVANGKEALQAMELIPYELVLMDCQMPVMDGFETTRKIREMEGRRMKGRRNDEHRTSNVELRTSNDALAGATGNGEPETTLIRGSGNQALSRKPTTPHSPLPTPHIPIVAMTAHALHGDRERCLDAGMDDYISKPVKQAVLSAAIQKYLPPGEVRIQTILIVDDDENIRSICRRVLEENGYTVRAAADGRKGLESIEERIPDLLLLDLNLPEITGPELLRTLHERKLPIMTVLITAFGDSMLMEQAMEFAPFTVLRKPFAANDILRIVAGLRK